MAENFPVLLKDTSLQFLEDELTPDRVIPKKRLPRHIIIKFLITKDKVLKAAYQ